MLSNLFETIKKTQRCVVAFSGGVDSTLVAFAARQVLGKDARIISFVTPLIAPSEILAAKTLSNTLGLDVEFIRVDPRTADPVYHNDLTRCYACKHLLFTQLDEITDDDVVLFDGTNFDDLSEDRPGLLALQELGVRSPLAECGINKEAVRSLSRDIGLPNANKPSEPCLATRFATAVALEDDSLARVADAEARIRALGFSDFRVRDYGQTARVEIANSHNAKRRRLITKALGYHYESVEFAERD